MNGQWSACSGSDELCDGKDNDCDGQIDEGLTQACTSCNQQGTMQCVNGSWSGCSAPTPTVEDCDNKDNDCDGMTDEGDNGLQLTKPCSSACGIGEQRCELNPNTNQKAWTPCDSTPSPEICDGIDNDCDNLIDDADPDVTCTCVSGQSNPCGKNIGECRMGTQNCVNGQLTVCGGPNYVAEAAEVCDGLDNDCDGIPDNNGNTIDSGTTACGVSNPTLNGIGECKIGLMMCQNAQLQCVNGMEQTPEICDNKDNDCDGMTDEPPLAGDQWESNNTCNTAAWIPNIIENQGSMTITPTLYPGSDVDWFKVTAKELEDFCFICGDDCEGPYTVTITLKNIPVGADYDLCVYDESCAGSQDTGTCEDEGIFEINQTPETYTFTWDDTCGGNGDKDFYIKVVSFSTPDSCTPPYALELSITAP